MYNLMGFGALILTGTTALYRLAHYEVGTTPPAIGSRLELYGLGCGHHPCGHAISARGSGHWIGGDQTDATGLPFFHWSTTGGDLRVAHFAALHLMQAVPFIAWFWPDKRIVAASLVAGVAVVARLTAQALLWEFPLFRV